MQKTDKTNLKRLTSRFVKEALQKEYPNVNFKIRHVGNRLSIKAAARSGEKLNFEENEKIKMKKIIDSIPNKIIENVRSGFIPKKLEDIEQKKEEEIEKNIEEITEEQIQADLLEKSKEIKKMGLISEIIGQWLWITGDTKPLKEKLKEGKCFWAPKKKVWYWKHPSLSLYYKRSEELSLDEIRKKFK